MNVSPTHPGSASPAAHSATPSPVIDPASGASGHAHCRLTRRQSVISWIFQGLAAAILFQTLFFKFTGAPESVYIFSTLGVEPWGRYAAGLSELVAVLLLLIPRFTIIGAAMAVGVMSGAIGSHLVRLGIVVQDDGGLLFALAWIVLLSALVILWIRREQIARLTRDPWGYLRGLSL